MQKKTVIDNIGTACIMCGAGSIQRYGVRLSVCPIRPLQQRAAGLLLWARRVGDIDRLMHGRRSSSSGAAARRAAAYAGSATFSAYVVARAHQIFCWWFPLQCHFLFHI